jgi:hypothetical protein
MDETPFQQWKRQLLASAGTGSGAVSAMGEVLEVFFRRGCEPTLFALLTYKADELHPAYGARTAVPAESTSALP